MQLPCGGGRYAGRRPQSVCHRPVGAGSSGIDPSPWLYPGADPWRRYLASCFPALGCGAFEDALTQGALAAAPDQCSVLAVDGKALRGLHGDELPGGRLVAAYAVEAGLGVGQKAGKEPA